MQLTLLYVQILLSSTTYPSKAISSIPLYWRNQGRAELHILLARHPAFRLLSMFMEWLGFDLRSAGGKLLVAGVTLAR